MWPTHGAGSFCSAPPGADRTSTIGRELATNPLLRAPDSDDLRHELLGSLGSYPPYFLRLGEINRRGPAILDHRRSASSQPLTVPGSPPALPTAPVVIDVRPVPATPPPTSRGPVHPAAGAVRDLAGLARPRPTTPLIIVRTRPGPRRDRLAGGQDRLRATSSGSWPAAWTPGSPPESRSRAPSCSPRIRWAPAVARRPPAVGVRRRAPAGRPPRRARRLTAQAAAGRSRTGRS